MDQMSFSAQAAYKKRLAAHVEANGSASEADEALFFAQAVELQTLKSPHSAVFAPLDEFTVQGGSGVYTVSGYVDSPNSYGTMLRDNFVLHVKKTEEGWVCTDTFVDKAAQIRQDIKAETTSSTIGYWILSIILTAAGYFIFKLLMDF